MIEIQCEQGTEEWDDLKLGVVSASRFKEIIKMNGDRSASRDKYLYELAAEKITGLKAPSYKNKHMERGNANESESRSNYAFDNNLEIREIGFAFLDDRCTIGASPDGLIDSLDAGFETKDKLPSLQLELIATGGWKNEHFHQCQGGMYVCGRKEWHLVAYSKGLSPVVKIIKRDEKFISKLAYELEKFVEDLNWFVQQHR